MRFYKDIGYQLREALQRLDLVMEMKITICYNMHNFMEIVELMKFDRKY